MFSSQSGAVGFSPTKYWVAMQSQHCPLYTYDASHGQMKRLAHESTTCAGDLVAGRLGRITSFRLNVFAKRLGSKKAKVENVVSIALYYDKPGEVRCE